MFDSDLLAKITETGCKTIRELKGKVMTDKPEIPDYFHTPNRADAQSDLLDALIWWTERYIDANCDVEGTFEENKGKARQAFYERFNVEVLQALKGDAQSMVELKDKVWANV